MYKIWNSKQHSFWYKLKEFAIEIFIIVFAVTLSIWLHERSEHKHKKEEVSAFLKGLKSDLTNDIKEMKQDKESYIKTQSAFHYINTQNKSLQKDSLDFYKQGIFSAIGPIPNDGRYEGFKSSGNIGFIDDKALQSDIMDFYQEDMKVLLLTTNYYSQRKEKFFDYYLNNLKRKDDGSTNFIEVMTTDLVQNYCRTLESVDEILMRYDSCITKAQKIITEIDTEYK